MNRPLRIFIDGHSFDRGYQGTQSFLRELYRGVHEEDESVQLFVGARSPERVMQALPFLPERRILLYKKNRPGWLRYFSDIPQWIREHRFEFAHFQYIAPKADVHCRQIVTTHDLLFRDQQHHFPSPYRWLRDPLFRRSIRAAAIRTTVSAYSQNRIAHHYRLPANSLHILPCALDGRFGEQDRRAAAAQWMQERYGIRNYLLCVSRIEPRKNQELLLRTFLRMRLYEQDMHLVLVGQASIAAPGFERILKDLNAEQRPFVHWFQQWPQSELETLYQGARAFLYPSHGEGFGIPPLEAALCRVPVLCSKATAMADFDFFEPFRFAPDAEHDFHRLLHTILEQPPTEEERARIRATVLQRFEARAVAKRFLQILKTAGHEAC